MKPAVGGVQPVHGGTARTGARTHARTHRHAGTGIILTNGRIRPRCRQRVACVRGEAAWRLQVAANRCGLTLDVLSTFVDKTVVC